MTKKKVHHKGEPIRLMSGEYGTVIVEDGDTYPSWFVAPHVEADEIEADNEE